MLINIPRTKKYSYPSSLNCFEEKTNPEVPIMNLLMDNPAVFGLSNMMSSLSLVEAIIHTQSSRNFLLIHKISPIDGQTVPRHILSRCFSWVAFKKKNRSPLDQLDFAWCCVQLVHAVGVREDDGIVRLSPWQLTQLNI